MPTLNDYNRRQYLRMIDAIDDYEKKNSSLASLVPTLEGLIGALEGISNEQRNELLRRWGALEEVHAVNLDEGTTEAVHSKIIAKAVQDLRVLVVQYTGNPPDGSMK